MLMTPILTRITCLQRERQKRNQDIFMFRQVLWQNRDIINFVNASKESLGVDKVDVSNHEKASESITMVQDAIEKAAGWRDDFGAVWEQLARAVKNADYTSQNTQQSESNIRDTDIGDEVLGYTTNQILVNASQSLLAQYNSSKDAVLVLLR